MRNIVPLCLQVVKDTVVHSVTIVVNDMCAPVVVGCASGACAIVLLHCTVILGQFVSECLGVLTILITEEDGRGRLFGFEVRLFAWYAEGKTAYYEHTARSFEKFGYLCRVDGA